MITNILNLPIEHVIYKSIFIYLSLKELFILKLVNKLFSDIIPIYIRDYCVSLNLTEISCLKRFNDATFKSITVGKTNLIHLILKDCKHWVSDTCMIPLIKTNQSLQQIEIEGCYSLTNQFFFMIGDYLLHLNQLNLAFCRELSAEALSYIGENLRNLRILNVAGCWNINDLSLQVISINNRNLEKINVSSCYAITDYAVENIAKNCLSLKSLNLSGCWRVSNKSVITLNEYSRLLREIFVKDCTNITEISLARMRPKKIKLDRAKPLMILYSNNEPMMNI